MSDQITPQPAPITPPPAPGEVVKGLACPRCGGMVPIPEGQVIVRCPFCDLRSMVKGERGVLRYQVPLKVERQGALNALHGFLSGNMAIAPGAAKQARLTEAFVVYLPFWTVWSRVLGWVFGEKRVGSGKNTRYDPREVKIMKEMVWNQAAADVGEFGVTRIELTDQPLEAFQTELLYEQGMVFEPLGSLSEAKRQADQDFAARVRRESNLDRVGQVLVSQVRARLGLVYYPLWVLRYQVRGRAFQVVVDGYRGSVLYGKAPGNLLYRAGMLVGGMAVGAATAVDVSTALGYAALLADDSDGSGWLAIMALAAVAIGFGIMGVAYRRFRYGEFYEFQALKPQGEAYPGAVRELWDEVNKVLE